VKNNLDSAAVLKINDLFLALLPPEDSHNEKDDCSNADAGNYEGSKTPDGSTETDDTFHAATPWMRKRKKVIPSSPTVLHFHPCINERYIESVIFLSI